MDFNVFPFLNTILVIDTKFDLKVFNQQTKNLEYHENYQYIVKKKYLPIQMAKISKN